MWRRSRGLRFPSSLEVGGSHQCRVNGIAGHPAWIRNLVKEGNGSTACPRSASGWEAPRLEEWARPRERRDVRALHCVGPGARALCDRDTNFYSDVLGLLVTAVTVSLVTQQSPVAVMLRGVSPASAGHGDDPGRPRVLLRNRTSRLDKAFLQVIDRYIDVF